MLIPHYPVKILYVQPNPNPIVLWLESLMWYCSVLNEVATTNYVHGVDWVSVCPIAGRKCAGRTFVTWAGSAGRRPPCTCQQKTFGKKISKVPLKGYVKRVCDSKQSNGNTSCTPSPPSEPVSWWGLPLESGRVTLLPEADLGILCIMRRGFIGNATGIA